MLNKKIHRIALFFLCFIAAATGYAQTGVLQGMVKEMNTEEAVISAVIGLEGTTIGVITDEEGAYKIEVPAGKHKVVVFAPGYEKKEWSDIVIEAGKVKVFNIDLKGETQKLNDVTVVAKANKESETILLMERREAKEVVQKIGAQEMTRKGVSNVAEGVTKVVGVSTPSNKALVVRGLGDRYNNVTINGLPVPSTHPDQKVIPLHIFPAGAIKNLAISKSYAPQYYGDFAGGMIDIVTKDYSEEHFVQVGLSMSGNSITTGKNFLYSYSFAEGYRTNASLGFAAGKRQLPGSVAATKYYDSKEAGTTKSVFHTRFSPTMKSARPAYGVNIATGDYKAFSKSGSGIGYYATFRHKNELKYTPGLFALYNAQQSPRYRYNTKNYNYSANTTGLLNVVYKLNAKNDIGYTFLYVNDALDNWIVLRGTDNDLGELFSRRNTYMQNRLITHQLYGKHELSAKNRVNWGVSWSNTRGDMPDRLQNTFRVTPAANGNVYTFAADAISNNHRFFGTLNDNEYSGKIEFVREDKEKIIGFTQLTGGINGRYKYRKFGSRQIDMKIAGGGMAIDPDNVDEAFEQRTMGDGVTEGSYKYIESYYAPNNYEAELAVASGYMNALYKIGKWNIIAGLRAEYATQLIYYKKGSDIYSAPYRKTDLTGIDLMPSLTIKKEWTSTSNVLFAASRTITRPQFVEMGPFRYNESFGTQEREGNPMLKNGTNYNVDIKYEWYPSPSEILSINLLGKYMQNPIELVIVASADPLLTYVNTDQAYLGGLELEYSRNIGKWMNKTSGFLNNSTVGFNAAFLYSQIEIGDLKKLRSPSPIALTHTRRPLMGASPYILNFDYAYRQPWSSDQKSYSLFTLTYNVFGKRVFAAGSQGAGDIYEMPVNTLDFIITTEFKKGFSFHLNLGNILNPNIVQKQQFENGSLTVLDYKRGLDFGLSIGYRL